MHRWDLSMGAGLPACFLYGAKPSGRKYDGEPEHQQKQRLLGCAQLEDFLLLNSARRPGRMGAEGAWRTRKYTGNTI